MADFDLEQLKTLFQNLADRLDQTDGDQDTLAELQKMRALMALMAKQMTNEGKAGGHRRENKEWLDQFWSTWKSQNPLGPLKQARQNGKVPQNTIIKKLQADKHGAKNPYDMFQQQTQASGKKFGSSLHEWSNSLLVGVKTMGGFFDNVKKNGVIATLGAGTFLELIGHAINGQADALRALKSAGDGSISSWSQMNHVANDANMSVEEMAKNFELAGNAGKRMGALQFTGLTMSLTKATSASGNLAMSLEDRTKAQSDYLDMLAQRADGSDISTDKMVAGIQRLVKSSEQTASILGMNRDEAIKLKKEQGNDTIMTDLVRRMGLNSDSVTNTQAIVEKTLGETSRKLLNYAIAGKAPQGDAASLAALDPKQYSMIQTLAKELQGTQEGGRGVDQVQIAKMIKQYGVDSQRDSMGKTLDMIGLGGEGRNAGLLAAMAGGKAAAASLTPTPIVDPSKDPATKSLLQLQAAEQAFANIKNTLFTAIFDPLMKDKDFFPSLIKDFKGLTTYLASFVKEMAAHPTLMKNLAKGFIALGTVVAGLGLAMGALKLVISPFLLLFKAGKFIGGKGSATVGSGAAGGGSLLARMFGKGAAKSGMSTLGNAASGSHGITKSLLGGVKGSALIGGLLESVDYIRGAKKLSARNLTKSALSVGGATLGGLAGGAVTGGFGGQFAGGVVGYKGGQILGDWLLGPDDIADKKHAIKPAIITKKAANDNPTSPADKIETIRKQYLIDTGQASSDKASKLTGPSLMASQVASLNPYVTKPNQDLGTQIKQPGAAIPPPVHADIAKGPKQLSIDEMTNKIMDASERAAIHLKAIRDSNETQVNLMRENIAISRNSNEKVQRLLEEGNRNTKRTADRSA